MSLHRRYKSQAKLLSHCVHPTKSSNIYQNVIKYVTYLILIKRIKTWSKTSTNNTATIVAPCFYTISFRKEYKTLYYSSWITMIRIRVTCSYSCWCMNTNISFSFSRMCISRILWSIDFMVPKSLYICIYGYHIISIAKDIPWPWYKKS